jgi:hypothetical protein
MSFEMPKTSRPPYFGLSAPRDAAEVKTSAASAKLNIDNRFIVVLPARAFLGAMI